ncbi:hypothetical protein H5410_006459 [Solanum commersonii]|uniref:Uncharacterized protein n=1 Tax=Solanum commersonii TaxID=4109 RepID=A0A9J6A9S7_SOLCO|nr:hypothetical protein H5410_006459 [Solanum commersonii]
MISPSIDLTNPTTSSSQNKSNLRVPLSIGSLYFAIEVVLYLIFTPSIECSKSQLCNSVYQELKDHLKNYVKIEELVILIKKTTQLMLSHTRKTTKLILNQPINNHLHIYGPTDIV